MSRWVPAFIPGGFASHKRGGNNPTTHGKPGGKAFNDDFVKPPKIIGTSLIKTGLELWIRSDKLDRYTPIGGSVASWPDQSGNNRNYSTSAFGGAQPGVLVNGRNGLPLVSFNGTNQGLGTLLDAISDSSDFTIHVVMTPNPLTGVERGSGDAPAPGWSISFGPSGAFLVNYPSAYGVSYGPSAGEVADNLASYTFTHRHSDGSSQLFANGVLVGIFSGVAGADLRTPGALKWMLGLANDGGYNSLVIGEQLVYARQLNAFELSINHSYLRNRWLLR